MSELMEKLLNAAPREKCARCKGSGIVTIDNEYISWTPIVCWCGACDGSGWADNGGSK
jgi:DnaJ-class molecular chaperone